MDEGLLDRLLMLNKEYTECSHLGLIGLQPRSIHVNNELFKAFSEGHARTCLVHGGNIVHVYCKIRGCEFGTLVTLLANTVADPFGEE